MCQIFVMRKDNCCFHLTVSSKIKYETSSHNHCLRAQGYTVKFDRVDGRAKTLFMSSSGHFSLTKHSKLMEFKKRCVKCGCVFFTAGKVTVALQYENLGFGVEGRAYISSW